MSDLRPMWEAICRDLGINSKLVCVHFLYDWEAKNDFGVFGWGGVNYGEQGSLPDVIVVFPYTEGKSGFHVDMVELKNTCYHELIHLLLRDEIEEEDVEWMGDILNRRQKGWRFWCSYLRGRAIARGLGPPDTAGMTLWQYARVERKRHRRKMSAESTNGIGRLTGAGCQDFDCSASKFSGENQTIE